MKYHFILFTLFFTSSIYSAPVDSLLNSALVSIEKEYRFEDKSKIPISDLGTLFLNNNFKFLNSEKTNDFVKNYWGVLNEEPNYLGLIMQKNKSIFDTSALLFTISFFPELIINTDNYDILKERELLEQLILSTDSNSSKKISEGIEQVKVTSWAIAPRYSKEHNCLYWAEEIVTGINISSKQISAHLRYIGNDGVMAFDCVSSATSLEFLKSEIQQLNSFFKFHPNRKYTSAANSIEKSKSIEYLILGDTLEVSKAGAFIFKFWKAIFFIIGICGVILFFQFKPSKTK